MTFAGAEQAVRFAYNISARSIMSRPTYDSDPGGTREGLSPHELHAQAAMIFAAVERLPVTEQAAVKALLAPPGERDVARVVFADAVWPKVKEAFGSYEQWSRAVRCATLRSREAGIRSLAKEAGISYRKARALVWSAIRTHTLVYLRGIGLLEDLLFTEGGLRRHR